MVPNDSISLVSLRDVIESENFKNMPPPLRFALGQDVAGTPVAANLAAMPHLLIAGATGSGKSVCVNSVLCCLLAHNTPDDLRLILVDPKRVELTNYNGIPHLLAPVVVEMERVVGALQWVTREMDARYQKFHDTRTRNITEYNRKIIAEGGNKLPYMVVVIDELADLMLLAPDQTEKAITRLAQLARATGIHLMIATQRPSVDVVTGLIKANFPARIAFAVSSGVDSRVILDQPGADRLLGRRPAKEMAAGQGYPDEGHGKPDDRLYFRRPDPQLRQKTQADPVKGDSQQEEKIGPENGRPHETAVPPDGCRVNKPPGIKITGDQGQREEPAQELQGFAAHAPSPVQPVMKARRVRWIWSKVERRATSKPWLLARGWPKQAMRPAPPLRMAILASLALVP